VLLPGHFAFHTMWRIKSSVCSINNYDINPLNAELNPICHWLALLGGATIVFVSRLRVKAYRGGEAQIDDLTALLLEK